MGDGAVKIHAIASFQNKLLIRNNGLKPAFQDKTALLTLVQKGFLMDWGKLGRRSQTQSFRLAVVLSCLFTLILGIPDLKLKGHYLVMAKLGFGEIVNFVFKEWVTMTGSPCGFVGIPMLGLGSFVLDTDLKYYLLVWLVVIGIIAFLINLTNWRVGRALQALKRCDDAAATMGVPVARYKIRLYSISSPGLLRRRTLCPLRNRH